jgi:hypothetical protein
MSSSESIHEEPSQQPLPDTKAEKEYSEKDENALTSVQVAEVPAAQSFGRYGSRFDSYKSSVHGWGAVVWKFCKFMGPGALISVAYIDPDNYQTAISAGAEFGYKLLFIVLVSNLIAIYLQVGLSNPLGI